LPAMIPVLVPTLFAAIGVMAASHYFGASAAEAKPMKASRIKESSASRSDGSFVRYAPGKSSLPLEFSYHHVLAGFELNVAWRTCAPRLAILGALDPASR